MKQWVEIFPATYESGYTPPVWGWWDDDEAMPTCTKCNTYPCACPLEANWREVLPWEIEEE